MLLITIVSANIRFYQEQITIRLILPDTIEVGGLYFFKNESNHPSSSAIFYPFPTDSGLSQAHKISVFSVSHKKNIQFTQKENGIEWFYLLKASSSDTVEVIYRQISKSFSGRYIVTTTHFWDQPLDSAKFFLICPPTAVLTFWSFPADTVYIYKDTLVYYASFSNFMPKQDVLFSWNISHKPFFHKIKAK